MKNKEIMLFIICNEILSKVVRIYITALKLFFYIRYYLTGNQHYAIFSSYTILSLLTAKEAHSVGVAIVCIRQREICIAQWLSSG